MDIVFIHGLRGRSHGTWTKNGVLWPRDLLAKDFPKARIMTVSRSTSLQLLRLLRDGPIASGATIRELCNSLVQSVKVPFMITPMN